MTGETGRYNPATVFARRKHAVGAYRHDMDHGLCDACRCRGGEGWNAAASCPPRWCPSRSIGGVLLCALRDAGLRVPQDAAVVGGPLS